MEPTREKNATLADVLDRALNKGLLINADLIISVADIPLIGVNLRAAIAGMETMLDYGMMRDWDEALRAAAGEKGTGQAAVKEKSTASLEGKDERRALPVLRSK